MSFEVRAEDRLVTWLELTWAIDCFDRGHCRCSSQLPGNLPVTLEGGRNSLTFLLFYFYLVVCSQFYILGQ